MCSGMWQPPRNGSLCSTTSPGPNASGPSSASTQRTVSPIAPRCAGLKRPCAIIRPRAVEQRAREVARLAEDGRVGGAHHVRAHLLRDLHELVADHAQRHRVDAAPARACRAGRPRAAGSRRRARAAPGRAGTSVVESSSSTIAGPREHARRPAAPRGGRRASRAVRAAEADVARRARSAAARPRQRAAARPRARAERGHGGVDQLDRLAGEAVAVDLVVQLVERRERAAERGRRRRPGRERHLALVVLAGVAHAQRPLDRRLAGEALGGERRPRVVLHRVEPGRERRDVDVVGARRSASSAGRRGGRRAACRTPRRARGGAGRSRRQGRATRRSRPRAAGRRRRRRRARSRAGRRRARPRRAGSRRPCPRSRPRSPPRRPRRASRPSCAPSAASAVARRLRRRGAAPPPRNEPGSMRPSTRFASVTVGSVPPRP